MQELVQLQQPLQYSEELCSHFFQEVIHVSSNTHDALDELQTQLVACEEQMQSGDDSLRQVQSGDDSLRQQHAALKTLTCTYLENIKHVINLLSRSVKYSSLHELISSGFLRKRVIRVGVYFIINCSSFY